MQSFFFSLKILLKITLNPLLETKMVSFVLPFEIIGDFLPLLEEIIII